MNSIELEPIESLLKKMEVVIFNPTFRTKDALLSIYNNLNIPPIILNTDNPKQFIQYLKSDKERLFIIESKQSLELDEIYFWIEENRFSINSTTIAIIENPLQLHVLAAVNIGIDEVISPPFSRELFIDKIQKAFTASSFRRNFIQISKDSIHLLDSNPDGAEEYINQQLKITNSPYLSKCILAEFMLEREEYGKAYQYFTQSLKAKPNNLRALLGIKELLIKTGFEDKAYEILKKIFTLYPAHPKNIFDAYKLCIKLANYDDMERLIQLYFNCRELDKRYDQYAAAAIYIRSVQLISKKSFERVSPVAKLFLELDINRSPYLLPLIKSLKVAQEAKTIKILLGYFNKSEMRHKSYRYAEYLHFTLVGNDFDIIESGRSLLKDGFVDMSVVLEVYALAAKVGRSEIVMELEKKYNLKKAG